MRGPNRVLVVVQLVERLLPMPEIRDLNPIIGKILSTNCIIEKDEIKEKEAGNDPPFQK